MFVWLFLSWWAPKRPLQALCAAGSVARRGYPSLSLPTLQECARAVAAPGAILAVLGNSCPSCYDFGVYLLAPVSTCEGLPVGLANDFRLSMACCAIPRGGMPRDAPADLSWGHETIRVNFIIRHASYPPPSPLPPPPLSSNTSLRDACLVATCTPTPT